jgi:hypothetical protein
MRKPFTTVAVLLLLIIAAAQATRAYFGIEVTFDGHAIPVTASWIAAVVAAFLALMLLMEAKK